MEPREVAALWERQELRDIAGREQFAGYGVMGLPFASGHVLSMRSFPLSSLGLGYISVWHRTPDGQWTFYSDAEPLLSCNRFFGDQVDRFEPTRIDLDWTGPRSFSIRIASADFLWDVQLAPTFATRLMNAVGRLIPDPFWRSSIFLGIRGRVAGVLLALGRVNLYGVAPNRQRFIANPRLIWTIPSNRARIGAQDLGQPGPLPKQAFLGDFAIPQRGVFVIGNASFDSFDPARHLATPMRFRQS